ncbi:hypothetical protein DXX94_11545 [Thalassotalea euphylliae]|uniref:Uncharacterized protein n=1 Tax=Thalassotalea euphylliae TaxID=1655234 RepID=A0A3E0U400_9GAMM|nr:hypothetical protein DXX94_11545 [Thalassotalea euphylliae]
MIEHAKQFEANQDYGTAAKYYAEIATRLESIPTYENDDVVLAAREKSLAYFVNASQIMPINKATWTPLCQAQAASDNKKV